MNKAVVLILLFLSSSFLMAQRVKQEIAWNSWVEDEEIKKESKTTTNYNKAGKPTSEYVKIDGIEYLSQKWTYDEQQRPLEYVTYSEVGEILTQANYKYKKGLIERKTYSAASMDEVSETEIKASRGVGYYYLNKEGKVTEAKVYETAEGDKKATLVNWTIKTYNSEGLLIGKRFKHVEDGLIKKTYHYDKKSRKLIVVKSFWKDPSTKELSEIDPEVYSYNAEGQLILKEYGVGESESYEYKDGELWVLSITEKGMCTDVFNTKHIYKDGILVRTKAYDPGPATYNVLGEKALESMTNYQYIYYE